MDKRGEWPLLPLGFGAIALGFIALALAGPYAVYSRCARGRRSCGRGGWLRVLAFSNSGFGPSLYIGIMSTGQIAAVAQGASASQAAAEGFSLAMLVASGVAAAGFVLSFLYARAARKRTAERIGHSVPCLALLMEPDPYTMPADSTVSQVMRAFVDLKVSGLPLVDAAGHPVGFVSDGDVMRYLADRHPVVTGAYSLMKAANDQGIDERLRELMLLPARTIATEKLIALDADATLEESKQARIHTMP